MPQLWSILRVIGVGDRGDTGYDARRGALPCSNVAAREAEHQGGNQLAHQAVTRASNESA